MRATKNKIDKKLSKIFNKFLGYVSDRSFEIPNLQEVEEHVYDLTFDLVKKLQKNLNFKD